MKNMERLIKKTFTFRNLSILLILLFLLSLLPIIGISFFNHPSADDFSFAKFTRAQFLESGSLLSTIKRGAEVSGQYYNNWQGTFSATFLMSLQPAVFNESLYFLTTFIMLFFLIAPTFFLVYTMIVKVFKCNPRYTIIFGIPICFFSTQYLPSLVEGFFWYPGAVFYTLFYGLMLFFMAMCLRFYVMDTLSGGKTKILFGIKVFICALTGGIIGGGNYVTALITTILIFFMAIGCLIKKKPLFLTITFSLLFFVTLLSLIISATAPGNLARQTLLDQPGALEAILLSFKEALRTVFSWTDLKIITAFILLMPAFYMVAKKTGFSFNYPLLVSLFSFCVFAAQYTPPLYAMNSAGEGRLQNVIYYSFIWLVTINVFYWTGWLAVLLKKHSVHLHKIPVKQYTSAAILVFVVFFLALCNSMKSTSAFICTRDFMNGAAKQYSEEAKERYEILHDKNIKQAELKAFSVKPEALFFDDITEDQEDWRNKAMASFYQKETVVLREEDQ